MKAKNKLLSEIQDLHRFLREDIRKKWNRVLPFNEEITDRWEAATHLGFGKGSSIYNSSIIIGNVKVGENTWIGPFTILDGSGGLEIGSYCSISSGVHLYSHDSVKWALSGGKAKYETSSVKIKDCCYIGPFSVITKGVTIGNHCLIGSHTLVNRDIPDFSIVLGIPGKIVGEVKIKAGEVELVYSSRK